MKKAGKIAIISASAVLAGLLIWSSVSLILSSGLPNLLIRNATAFDKNIEALEWSGKTYEKVQYANVSETDYLDLYVPDDVKNPPLYVFVHGGGFVYNDSQSRQALLTYQYFRANGYAVASINYRLAQEAIYPAAVNDVKAAVRYLIANADTYGYDATRIAIGGESAGGYLASIAALSSKEEFTDLSYVGQGDNPVEFNVDALLDYYGVIDFDKYLSDFEPIGTPKWLLAMVQTNTDVAEQFIGKEISALTQDELNNLSPTYRVTSGVADKDLKAFFIHGSVDITVSYLQSQRLYDACSGYLGSENCEFHLMKNYKHADDKFYTSDSLAIAKEFLDKNI